MNLPDWKNVISIEGGTDAQREEVIQTYDDFFSSDLGKNALSGIIEYHGNAVFRIHHGASIEQRHQIRQAITQGLNNQGDVGSNFKPNEHVIDFYPEDFERRRHLYLDENLKPQPYTKDMAQIHETMHLARGHNYSGTVYTQCNILFEKDAMAATNIWLESKGLPKAAAIYAGIDLRGAEIKDTEVCFQPPYAPTSKTANFKSR